MNRIRVPVYSKRNVPQRISKYHAIPILSHTHAHTHTHKNKKTKPTIITTAPYLDDERTRTNHPAIFSPFHTTFHSSFHPSTPYPPLRQKPRWKWSERRNHNSKFVTGLLVEDTKMENEGEGGRGGSVSSFAFAFRHRGGWKKGRRGVFVGL